jgi:PHD-finger
MICCERCNVWQHGPCVGVMSENEAPGSYFCEECRPDLHELGNRNQGYSPLPSLSVLFGFRVNGSHRQSRWIGSSMPQQPSRRKKSTSSAAPQGSLKGESVSPPPSDTNTSSKERRPSPKKRSTMNSRDAAYDFSALFTNTGDEETKLESTISPPASRSGESRTRRRGKRVPEEDEEDPPRTKRRRESNETEDPTEDGSSKGKRKAIKRKEDSDTMENSAGKDDSSSDNVVPGTSTPIIEPPPRSNGKKTVPQKRKVPSTKDRVESEEPPLTPTFRKMEEIRPARARIPQARSGLNEMRKRVGAILEYVGRLQADVTPSGNVTPVDPGTFPFSQTNCR